jgi:hypothetical protein
MRLHVPGIPVAGTLALLVGAAACSRDMATNLNGTSGGAPLAVQIAATGSSASASSVTSVLTGLSDHGGPGGFGEFGDGGGHHWRGWWGWMRTRNVDSLIVTATKLEVLTALPDSEDAADSLADSARADSGRGHDHDHDRFEHREFGWTVLSVIGDGHLDLIHLPDSAAAGLPIATGTLPAGTYRRVRLFVTNPMIYFDSLIVTPAGDSLQPNVGYPVIFPSADSTGAIFKTDDPFVVPAVGDTVGLFFDRDDTVRHIIITGDGKIIVPPTFRFHHGRGHRD